MLYRYENIVNVLYQRMIKIVWSSKKRKRRTKDFLHFVLSVYLERPSVRGVLLVV